MSLSNPISSVTVPAAASVADATILHTRGVNRGQIGVPTGSLVTQLGFHAQTVPGGAFRVVHDGSGAVTLAVTAAKSYAIPTAALGGIALKIVANTFSGGTVTETNFEVNMSSQAT